MVSTTEFYLVAISYYPFIHSRVAGPPITDSALLNVADPARHYLEGWIDGGAQSEYWISPTIGRTKKREVKKEYEVIPPSCVSFPGAHCHDSWNQHADIFVSALQVSLYSSLVAMGCLGSPMKFGDPQSRRTPPRQFALWTHSRT